MNYDRELLRAIAMGWNAINTNQFRDALRPPLFALSDGSTRLGEWDPRQRSIQLSRKLVYEHTWVEVVEVLRHEMAHQYVSEVLRVRDETAHGPAFRRVCAEHGIDASASGAPSANPAHERIMKRIRALLALADSPNEHEAQLAARKAFALMHAHNVSPTPSPLGYCSRQIGPVKCRYALYEKVLAGMLGKHFFVEPLLIFAIEPKTGKSGRTLEVSGRSDNVEMAAYVHDWLLATGERLFVDFKRATNTKSNKERRNFLLGVVQGFSRQLSEQRTVCEETGLVWLGDPKLQQYVRRRHPYVDPGRGGTYQRTDAYNSGLAEGQRLDLKRPVAQGPDGPVRTLSDGR